MLLAPSIYAPPPVYVSPPTVVYAPPVVVQPQTTYVPGGITYGPTTYYNGYGPGSDR